MSNANARPRPAEHRPSNLFRVPVQRQRVVLTLSNGSRHEGDVFRTPDYDANALLESSEPFLPIEVGGAVRLYSRGTIAAVTLRAEDEAEADLAAVSLRRAVVAHLRSGARLEGELRFVAEYGRARAVDHLNLKTRSFALYEGSLVHHVDKDQVEHVEEQR